MAHVPFRLAQAAPDAAHKAPTPTLAFEFSSPVVFAISAETSCGRICWKESRSVLSNSDPVLANSLSHRSPRQPNLSFELRSPVSSHSSPVNRTGSHFLVSYPMLTRSH